MEKSALATENIKANSNYNSANRDFQRTEGNPDDISRSEKEELEKRKQRTQQASITPDKNHVE